MIKHFKYITAVFVIALFVSAIESTPAKAGLPQLPPNHEELAEVCLCFGKLFNGFNATGTQPNGQCARFQMGPFCFVDTELMPVFWKVQLHREVNTNFVGEGGRRNLRIDCPPDKMVVSCGGAVSFNCPGPIGSGPCQTPAANVGTNVHPTFDQSACRLLMVNNGGERRFTLSLDAICAAPEPGETIIVAPPG